MDHKPSRIGIFDTLYNIEKFEDLKEFTPKELDLPFEVPKLFTGDCGSSKTDVHYLSFSKSDNITGHISIAHTHSCPKDPLYRVICVRKEKFLKVPEVLWHEYAHVLDDILVKACKEISCGVVDSQHKFTLYPKFAKLYSNYYSSDFSTRLAHGPSWTAIMDDLGIGYKKIGGLTDEAVDLIDSLLLRPA